MRMRGIWLRVRTRFRVIAGNDHEHTIRTIIVLSSCSTLQYERFRQKKKV